MVVTIHQPDFLPWLGFFDRWKRSDIYVVLDDVQFLRRGWHHRDKIKTAQGVRWLTVPVHKKDKYNQLIREVKIDNTTSWRKNHLKTVEFNYKKAPNFDDCFKKITEIYNRNHSFLIDLNMALLRFVASELKIRTPVVLSSEFHVQSSLTQRLVDLVKSVHGSIYLTGPGAKDYLDESLFRKENIQVTWQEYTPLAYKQLHGKFVSMLSSLDYLMMRDLTLI